MLGRMAELSLVLGLELGVPTLSGERPALHTADAEATTLASEMNRRQSEGILNSFNQA